MGFLENTSSAGSAALLRGSNSGRALNVTMHGPTFVASVAANNRGGQDSLLIKTTSETGANLFQDHASICVQWLTQVKSNIVTLCLSFWMIPIWTICVSCSATLLHFRAFSCQKRFVLFLSKTLRCLHICLCVTRKMFALVQSMQHAMMLLIDFPEILCCWNFITTKMAFALFTGAPPKIEAWVFQKKHQLFVVKALLWGLPC